MIHASALRAQRATDTQPRSATEALCAQATSGTVQPPAIRGPLTAAQLPSCNEQALYYGFTGTPKFPAALQCGWYQYAHPQTSVGNMFYGPGVLSMLYANGEGVPRNYDLAIRLVCENPWAAPAELEGRVTHLKKMRDANTPDHFDLCDDATSGLSEGACEAISAGKHDSEREQKLSAIEEHLPAAALTQFAKLRTAEKAFEDARSRNEVDLSGTGRAAFEIAEQQKLSDQFLINLQRFSRKDIPLASTKDLALLDEQLNAVYQQLLHAPASDWQYSTINPDGIRATQRAWLELADAWIAFARTAYPDLSSESVRAQLIRLRIHQLRSLLPRH